MRKLWLLPALCLLASACATAPDVPRSATLAATGGPDPSLLADHLFPAPPPAALNDDIFALSPEMVRYLETTVAARARGEGPREGLFNAIRLDLLVQYDASSTRTAIEAFNARAGNCLSLVVLTSALARQMEIPVRYQSVFDNDSWSRNNGMAFLSGHVNITLGQRPNAMALRRDSAPALTIDFLLPQGGQAAMHTRSVDENTIIAMYRNNRAAENLAQGRLNDAYWWVREALRISPGFSPSYNTLGVVYRHHGEMALAESAFRFALQREPANELVLANLADLLSKSGRVADARAIRKQLDETKQIAPYHYHELGLAALKGSDYQGALRLFKQQLKRTPYDHEVLFAYGMTQMVLGDLAEARSYVSKALDNSTTRQSAGIYAAKLEHFKTLEQQN